MPTRSAPIAGLEVPATRVDAHKAVARFGNLDNHLATAHDGLGNLDSGDGSPPLTAFTADDSYAMRSLAVKRIVRKFAPDTQYPASDSLPHGLQPIQSWFGSSIFLIAVRRC